MKIKQPKISIITICYNSEEHIEECIQSVIAQNYENKEYIVIDGGSEDSTLNIIDKYKEHIDYLVSEPDNGISDAFNKGIKNCTGEIIGILNSDDIMMSEALESVANEYERDVNVYRGNLLYWDEKTGKKFIQYPNMKFRIPPFNPKVCHGASFITKKTYDQFGGYKEDFDVMMDLDLFLRLFSGNAKFKTINKTIFTFRMGGVSSGSEWKRSRERRRLIIENGGTNFQAFIYVTYWRIRYILKKILDIFGSDIKLFFQFKRVSGA